MKADMKLICALAVLAALVGTRPAIGQTLDKVRLGNSGTGINVYLLDIGTRMGLLRKNGIDLEAIYVSSGSLLNQALLAGTFDMVMSQGSEAMMMKLRGADLRINAVVANRFNHVYLTTARSWPPTSCPGRRKPALIFSPISPIPRSNIRFFPCICSAATPTAICVSSKH